MQKISGMNICNLIILLTMSAWVASCAHLPPNFDSSNTTSDVNLKVARSFASEDVPANEWFDFHVHSHFSGSFLEICHDCSKNSPVIDTARAIAKLDEVFSAVDAPIQRAGVLWILKGWQESHFNTGRGGVQKNQFEVASKIINAYPKTILGICGLRLRQKDFVEETERCLSYSGLVGIKLYPDADGITASKISFDPAKDEFSRQFERALAVLNRTQGLVLIHFPQKSNSTSQPTVGSPERVQNLIKLMAKYPNATLILAHSGEMSMIGWDGLRAIGEFFRQHPELRANIYLETSGSLVHSYPLGMRISSNNDETKKLWRQRGELVEVWRQFGMERVLAGSDFPLFLNGGHNFISQDIFMNPYLSDIETDMILRKNAGPLLKKIKSTR